MEQVKTGFFFECSREEILKLEEIGDGSAGNGLRMLLERCNGVDWRKLAQSAGKNLLELAPQIILGLARGRSGKK